MLDNGRQCPWPVKIWGHYSFVLPPPARSLSSKLSAKHVHPNPTRSHPSCVLCVHVFLFLYVQSKASCAPVSLQACTQVLVIRDNTVSTWLQSHTNTRHFRNRPMQEERDVWKCFYNACATEYICVCACLSFYLGLKGDYERRDLEEKERSWRSETRGRLVKVKANAATLPQTHTHSHMHTLSVSTWTLPNIMQGHRLIITLLFLSSHTLSRTHTHRHISRLLFLFPTYPTHSLSCTV